MPAQIESTSDLSALSLSDTERSTPDRFIEHRRKATLLTLPAEIRLQVLRPNNCAEFAMRRAHLSYCGTEIQDQICWGCQAPHVISTTGSRHTQVLLACHKLYEEGRAVLYDDRVFCLSTSITDEALVILEDGMYNHGIYNLEIEVIRLQPSQAYPEPVLTLGLESNGEMGLVAGPQVNYLFHLDRLRQVSYALGDALLGSHKLTLRFHMTRVPGYSTAKQAAMALYNEQIRLYLGGNIETSTTKTLTARTSDDADACAVEEAIAIDQMTGQTADPNTRPDWDDTAATALWSGEIEQIRILATTGVWTGKGHFLEQIHRTSHELFELQRRLTWGRRNISAQQNIKFFLMYRTVHYYAGLICLNLAHKCSDIKDSNQYAAKAIFHLTCIIKSIEGHVGHNHPIHHMGFDKNTDHIRAFVAATRMLWLEAIAWLDNNENMSCIDLALDAVARALQPYNWTKGTEKWRKRVNWMTATAKESSMPYAQGYLSEEFLVMAWGLPKKFRARSCRILVREVWGPLSEQKWPHARREAFRIPSLEEVDQW